MWFGVNSLFCFVYTRPILLVRSLYPTSGYQRSSERSPAHAHCSNQLHPSSLATSTNVLENAFTSLDHLQHSHISLQSEPVACLALGVDVEIRGDAGPHKELAPPYSHPRMGFP